MEFLTEWPLANRIMKKNRTIILYKFPDLSSFSDILAVNTLFHTFSMKLTSFFILLLLLLHLTQLLLHDAFNNVAPVCSILCQFNQFI